MAGVLRPIDNTIKHKVIRMDDNTKDVLCQMSDASYEYHKGVAKLARNAGAKPSQEIIDGLSEAEMALEEQRKNVVSLKARLAGN